MNQEYTSYPMSEEEIGDAWITRLKQRIRILNKTKEQLENTLEEEDHRYIHTQAKLMKTEEAVAKICGPVIFKIIRTSRQMPDQETFKELLTGLCPAGLKDFIYHYGKNTVIQLYEEIQALGFPEELHIVSTPGTSNPYSCVTGDCGVCDHCQLVQRELTTTEEKEDLDKKLEGAETLINDTKSLLKEACDDLEQY